MSLIIKLLKIKTVEKVYILKIKKIIIINYYYNNKLLT